MSEFRTTGDDVLKPPRKAESDKPGTLPEGRYAVLDHKGRMRGHVGKLATSVTASRFLDGKPATLGKDKDGRTCWREKSGGENE